MGNGPRGSCLRIWSAIGALSLIAAACTSSSEATGPTTIAADDLTTTESVAPTSTTSTTTPRTTTTEPEPAEYPPGVVWEQSVVSETRGLRVTTTEPTPDGWIVTAFAAAVSDATSMVFTSSDGTEWVRSDLPNATASTFVNDVVYGPAGYVAIGFAGRRCNGGCPAGDGVAWVSIDGKEWQLVEPGAMTGPNKIVPREIRVIDGRYVAVGNDQGDGTNQVIKVWSSADGFEWEETAVLDDPDWPVRTVEGFLAWNDGYLVTASAAVCAQPNRHAIFGWVWSIAYSETLAWSSPDGTEWTPIDLASDGLIEPLPEDACSGNGPADETKRAARGRMTGVGGRLIWTGGIADTMEMDASSGAWEPSEANIPSSVEDATHLWEFFLLSDDTGYIAATMAGRSNEVWVPLARSEDLVTWQDAMDDTTLFPPLGDEYSSFAGAIITTNGTELISVYQASTGTLGEEGPIMALVSRAAPIP